MPSSQLHSDTEHYFNAVGPGLGLAELESKLTPMEPFNMWVGIRTGPGSSLWSSGSHYCQAVAYLSPWTRRSTRQC